MSRCQLRAFIAPHHPIGEHPMLQFRRVSTWWSIGTKLGYEEFLVAASIIPAAGR